MHTGPFVAGSWHVIRLPSTSRVGQREHLYRFYRTLVDAYHAAGAPQEFEVYRSLSPRSLYAYLSPRATALAADGLKGKGFKLVPLREEFDVEALPDSDIDRLLPKA